MSSMQVATMAPLSSDEIDKKLQENESMLEEWRQLYLKGNKLTTRALKINNFVPIIYVADRNNNIVTPADAVTHTQLRRRINENLSSLAAHLKIFFASAVCFVNKS